VQSLPCADSCERTWRQLCGSRSRSRSTSTSTSRSTRAREGQRGSQTKRWQWRKREGMRTDAPSVANTSNRTDKKILVLLVEVRMLSRQKHRHDDDYHPWAAVATI